jgi:hypothetical protein
MKIFSFGHCWVVLSIALKVPFSSRIWSLPVLFRLYRSEADCAKRGTPFKKKTELAREMVDVLVGWTRIRGQRVELSGDCAYCNETVMRGLSDRVVLFGAMRPVAVLFDRPVVVKSKNGGRPRIRGRLLPKPEHVARDQSVPWKRTKANLYGRTTTVYYKTFCGQWYRAMGARWLRIVIVRCANGVLPFRVFFCTDSTLGVVRILETYSGRWSIEVFFREAKQLLGFADSQARKAEAVLRVAPLVGLLYSTLVIWFAESAFTCPEAALPIRPWYKHKRGLCFADALRTAQRALGTIEVLVPLSRSDNLQQPGGKPRVGRDRRRKFAA